MKNHEMVTLLRDDQRLTELEKVIARGKKPFVEVGMALAEIRDLRLYRREYGSFAEYCQSKWGWTRQHAYRLIEAAPIGKSNLQVTSLNQARELAKVEPSQRAGVVQAIVDQGKPVTAKEILRHLPPPPMVRSGTNGSDGRNGESTPHPALPPIEAERGASRRTNVLREYENGNGHAISASSPDSVRAGSEGGSRTDG